MGHRGSQPDGRPHPVPHLQGGPGHRPQPARAVPGALRVPGQPGPVGTGGGRRDGDRPGRVRGRRDRPQPRLRHPALRGRPDHGRGRLRGPGAAAAGVPPLRACRHRPARAGRPGFPLPVLRGRRPELPPGRGGPGAAPERRHGRPGGRHHRRDRDAARGLPALRPAEGPDRDRRHGGTPHPAHLEPAGLLPRAGPRRSGQHGHALHRRRPVPPARADWPDRARLRLRPPRLHGRRRRRAGLRRRSDGLGPVLVQRRHLRRPGRHVRLHELAHSAAGPPGPHDGPGAARSRLRGEHHPGADLLPAPAVLRHPVRRRPAAAHQPRPGDDERYDQPPADQRGATVVAIISLNLYLLGTAVAAAG